MPIRKPLYILKLFYLGAFLNNHQHTIVKKTLGTQAAMKG